MSGIHTALGESRRPGRAGVGYLHCTGGAGLGHQHCTGREQGIGRGWCLVFTLQWKREGGLERLDSGIHTTLVDSSRPRGAGVGYPHCTGESKRLGGG